MSFSFTKERGWEQPGHVPVQVCQLLTVEGRQRDCPACAFDSFKELEFSDKLEL